MDEKLARWETRRKRNIIKGVVVDWGIDSFLEIERRPRRLEISPNSSKNRKNKEAGFTSLLDKGRIPNGQMHVFT